MKSRSYFRFIIVAAIFGATRHANAADWWVSVPPCSTNGQTCGTSEANSCCQIDDAVDRSDNGDTVFVKPGEYVGADGLVTFGGKAITLISTAGPEATIIIGTSLTAKVRFVNGEGPASILEGFTLTGGTGSGVSITNSSPTIRGNIIRDNNLVGGSGGGIHVVGGSAVIEDNLICNNSADSGGGIYAQSTVNLIIRDCTIVGNSATTIFTSGGGGMRLTGGGSVTVSRCVLADNQAVTYGGGIASKDVEQIAGECLVPLTVNIDNTLFFGNKSTQESGGGMSIGDCTLGTASHVTFSRNDGPTGPGVYASSSSGPYTITESILWGNAVPGDGKAEIAGTGSLTVTYSDVEQTTGVYPGTGNINADPLFFDPSADNYHIKTGSPCIDTALGCDTSAVDLDGVGHSRCKNGVEDMGAYEHAECAADADCDDDLACNGLETCVTGVCQRTALEDCNCNGVHDDCEEPLVEILYWESVITHGANNTIGLEVGLGGTFSESRDDGIVKLRITFSNAIDPSRVSASNVTVCGNDVNNQAVNLSGITVSTTVLSGDTSVDINFSPKLPNFARYRVRIDDVRDLECHRIITENDRILTSLFCDTTGDRRINSTDLSLVRSKFGTSPIDPTQTSQVRSDVDNDDDIDQTDEDSVRVEAQAGVDARFIADPSCP